MSWSVRKNVLRDIEASGPMTLHHLRASAASQCGVPPEELGNDDGGAWILAQVVAALNDLTREGVIELYDTGDSWVTR